MTRYRRAASGSTFFFTLVSHRRRPILCEDVTRNALRDAIAAVRAARPFRVDAWVLLPDHMHCIWTLPDGDSDYSTRWAQIKRSVSRNCRAALHVPAWLSDSGRKHRESTIWQRRYWEHCIRDDIDFERHVNYIHFNPVRHGHVAQASEWPYSTFHRYVRDRIYPPDWAGGPELAAFDWE